MATHGRHSTPSKSPRPLQPSKTIRYSDAAVAMQKSPLLYDKGAEEHYNVISAFIKSMRGSDPTPPSTGWHA